MAATMWKSAEAISLLVSLGANPDVPDANGISPLIYAITHGDIATANALLDSGAMPTCSWNDTSALEFSLREGMSRLSSKLIEKGRELGVSPDVEVVFLAMTVLSQDDRLSVVGTMLSNGLDPNTTSSDGWSLITLAIAGSDDRLVGLLLAYGASPRASDPNGRNAIQQAASITDSRLRQIIQEMLARFGSL